MQQEPADQQHCRDRHHLTAVPTTAATANATNQSTLHNIQRQDKAHQLIPIQKFLTSIKNDVRETCEAINAVRE